MTTEPRCAVRSAVALALSVGPFVSSAVAAPTERFAEREGLACATCHVGTDGGPLTAFGRDYRWRAPFFQDGQEGGELAAPVGAGSSSFGRWSGELASFARSGRDRAFGERTHTWSATETLRLRGDELFGDESLSFRGDGFASNWDGSGDYGFDEDSLGLSSAEVTWRGDAAGSFVRFGRQFVVAGAATRRVDGAAIRQPLGERLELDLFGGAPVEDGLGGRGGDLITGGRLGVRLGQSLRFGSSAYYAKDHSDPSDVKGGLDLQWSPTRRFELFTHFYWDWLADQLYDARAHLVFTPTIEWQFAYDWTRSVPGLFLPKSSLYSVFSDEEYVEHGLTVTRRFSSALSANVFGRHTDYAESDSLAQVGSGLDARYGPNGEDAVGAEAGWQDESRTSFGGSSTDDDALFARIWHLLWWTGSIYTAVDASTLFVMDDSFERDAALVRIAAGYDPHAWWDAEIGTDWVRDPDFESRLDLFARLRIRF